MIIQIDWFKPSGKWYAGENININVDYLFDKNLHQEIVDKQTSLSDNWPGNYFVVLDDLPESSSDPNYSGFFKCMLAPEAFKDMKKTEVKE